VVTAEQFVARSGHEGVREDVLSVSLGGARLELFPERGKVVRRHPTEVGLMRAGKWS
jgi:hypothetical protein